MNRRARGKPFIFHSLRGGIQIKAAVKVGQQETKRYLYLLLGPVLFLVALLLPSTYFSFGGKAALGTILWMAGWWIIRPVDIAVTALLPIAVNALFGLIPMEKVIGQYSSEIVVLLLGADLVSITWSETGLDKRISLKALCWIGPSLRQQIVLWFCASALLSAFLPNIVVCAIMIPIAVSMLHYIGEHDLAKSDIAVVILLAVAWGTGIGGCGSPLGGAMNLVAINYIEALTGSEFMYISWVVRFVPFLLILSVMNILYLCSIKTRVRSLPGTKEYFRQMYQKLPPMKRGERLSLILFLAPMLLSFARPLYATLFPTLKPAYVFLLFGLVAFLFNKEDKSSLLDWATAERHVMWGMLLLFAGGLALGTLITETGAAASIADVIATLHLSGGFLTVLVFVVFACLLAEVSSNTAAAAISIPVVISITQTLNLNPIPYIYITSVAFNCAYVLPLAVRAIPVGYGMEARSLVRYGVVLAMAGALLISIVGYLFLRLWPAFSVI